MIIMITIWIMLRPCRAAHQGWAFGPPFLEIPDGLMHFWIPLTAMHFTCTSGYVGTTLSEDSFPGTFVGLSDTSHLSHDLYHDLTTHTDHTPHTGTDIAYGTRHTQTTHHTQAQT